MQIERDFAARRSVDGFDHLRDEADDVAIEPGAEQRVDHETGRCQRQSERAVSS